MNTLNRSLESVIAVRSRIHAPAHIDHNDSLNIHLLEHNICPNDFERIQEA